MWRHKVKTKTQSPLTCFYLGNFIHISLTTEPRDISMTTEQTPLVMKTMRGGWTAWKKPCKRTLGHIQTTTLVFSDLAKSCLQVPLTVGWMHGFTQVCPWMCQHLAITYFLWSRRTSPRGWGHCCPMMEAGTWPPRSRLVTASATLSWRGSARKTQRWTEK